MSYRGIDREPNPADAGDARPPLKLIALVLLVAGLAVFVFQNGDDVQVHFLWMDVSWPVSVLIGISVALGIAIDRLASWLWRRAQHRKQLADD